MRNLVMILVLCLALAGCTAKNESLPAVTVEKPPSDEVVSAVSSCMAEAPEESEQGDYPMMVMADGVLYTYEKPCEDVGRCGMMDGTITSSVSGVPEKDGQSNFGTGYEYQFLGDAIDVYFPEEDVWKHFVSQHIRFQAEVESVSEEESGENWMVVRSLEGEWSEGERFMISLDDWSDSEPAAVGMLVQVECGDMVLETEPAQLDVYGVTLLKR